MREWWLYLGDVRLGRLVTTAEDSDFPWYGGFFHPEPAFTPLAPLFAEAWRLMRVDDFDGFQKVWQDRLCCDRLRARSVSGVPEVARVVLIHFLPDQKARWTMRSDEDALA